MGAASMAGAAAGAGAGAWLAAPTGGLSVLAGAAIGAMIGQTAGGVVDANQAKQEAKGAANRKSDELKAQGAAADKRAQDILTQPQMVAPDNSSQRRKRLESLRMGIASTVKNGVAGTPVLSSPTLVGGPTKTKLGA